MSLDDAASLAIAAINLKAEQKEGAKPYQDGKSYNFREKNPLKKYLNQDLQTYAQNAAKFSKLNNNRRF